MYTDVNFKTKKALKEAVESGRTVRVFQPGGVFAGTTNGKVYLEGPHFPAAHTWYASATVVDEVIQKGSVK